MPLTLAELSAIEDIRILKHRYFRGIDTADWPLVSTLFTEDVAVDYRGGSYRVTLTGRADLLEFLANSFHSGFAAMHHGHMPEITLSGDDEATGVWYLEDVAIDVERRVHVSGSAIYRDHYRREADGWKIATTEYDRVIEVVRPLAPGERVTVHHLARHGRLPEERRDISHLIRWSEPA